MPIINQQTDSAATPTITILIALIRLQSTKQMIVPIHLQSTDQLIDKLYTWPLSLPPLVPYYHPNRPLLLPPVAKPIPYCLPTAPQAQRKERTASGGIYGQGYIVICVPKRPWPTNETTAFLQHHKHKERTASGGIYGPRLCNHVRPQTPVTYEQDNCHTNTPMDRQEFVPIRLQMRQLPCQYAYGQR